MKKRLFSLFPWLQQGIDPNCIIGVATYAKTVNAVCLKQIQGLWQIEKTHTEYVTDLRDYTTAITTCTNEVSRQTCAVNLVVPHYFYQILQMEKPNLTDEEIIQSLPWTSKDLVNIAPENIVADFIDYPIALPMQSKKMNVFITDKQQIIPLINCFIDTDAVLRSLTSEEMVLLALFGKNKDAHMLVVQHADTEPRILIVRDGQLVLVRRLNGFIGITDKDSAVVDALALEIQRSMDFFESQLKQPPIRSVQLQCDNLSSLAVRAELAELLQIKVVDFQPNSDMAKGVEKQFYYALGAALLMTNKD
ncbi:MSHA biogenesis protein MshI [Pseudoalteromonas sp. NEC-BIFX-2020_015]|uniref:MSHA biogenesis protein MshI n=1 Tax=Pseudoalteromonas sp. NEC-BIFX-2020_015 TaxID=2729544 RepID=UPI001461503F|nr:MSHA biogenesis protein MshI [Pseudoalteromonas sp. NEC-BIFX-2020_015]NMR25024.1 MSHA biogenesis protein MshI [Pseudoalteromonas sp. NEC-BIFX-2020_015]